MKEADHTGKRNRRALIVGFSALAVLAATGFGFVSTSVHPNHLSAAEDAFGNWLAAGPQSSKSLKSRLHRALNTWDRRPKVLAALTEHLRHVDPNCDPNKLQRGDRAICLVRHGCLKRAARIYRHVLTGSDRRYVSSLLERLSHRVSCRLGEPPS